MLVRLRTRGLQDIAKCAILTIFISLFFSLPTSMLSCRAEGIGVIYTSEYENKTIIDCLDADFMHQNSTTYPYSGMSFDGFMNSCALEDVVYLNPRGLGGRLDYGKIAALNTTSMEVEEYDFGRVNIISHWADEFCIYATSNLNGVCFLDKYNRCTGIVETVKTDSITLDSIIVSEGIVYALGFDAYSRYSLYSADFCANQLTAVITLAQNETPCFLAEYNGNIIFTFDNTLYMFNTRTDALNQYSLNGGKAFNLQINGDYLYVGHTDLFSLNSSSIEVIDLREMKMKTTLKHPSTILQIEVGNEDSSLYIMDYDSISNYRMNDDGEYSLHNRMELCPYNDQYVGGFFLRKI